MSIAFFDLDKTIVSGSSAAAFVDVLRRNKFLSWKAVAKLGIAHANYKLNGGHEQSMQLARMGLEMTKGWHRPTVNEIVEAELEKVIEPIVFKDARAALSQHEADGDLVVIVSSSPEEVVKPIARYLGISEVIASRTRVDEGDVCTGELEYLNYGEAKPVAMAELAAQHDVNMSDTFGYSDSLTDLPMLEAVGHPVAVNPDPELRRIADERGWTVRTFK